MHLSIAGANCNEGGTQNNLGNALRTLGEHESDTARLEAAVSAFRDVLKEFTRERAPAYQGIVQRSLEWRRNSWQRERARLAATGRWCW